MIHYDIPKPKLSPNFTIDDIHKIREWNYERTKDALKEEYFSFGRMQTEQAMKSMGLTCVFDKKRNAYVLTVQHKQ